jgi:S-adenosylmethionine decarboxylase
MKAKIWNYKGWTAETNPDVLFAEYDANLRTAGFNVLGNLCHHFQPFGYSAVFLLGESHLAIHTFPEEGKTYIELSSCSEVLYDKFIALINASPQREYLRTLYH